MSGFLSSFIIFLLSFKEIFCRSYKFKSIPFYIRSILVLTLITFPIAYIVWNQPFPNTFRSSIVFFNFSFFFLLKKYKITEGTIIKCIYIYTIIVILLWTYAISQAPTIVFGRLGDDDTMELVNNRGGFRITILGTAFSTICLFYLLNKVLIEKKNTIILLSLVFLLFVFNCTNLTRSNILSIVIGMISLFYMCNKNKIKFFFRTTFIFLILGSVLWYLFRNNIESLLTLTEDQFNPVYMTDNYGGLYRLEEYEFFFTKFKNSPLTFLFGNGMPNSSSYSIYIDSLKAQGYYLSDVNYANIFISLGLVGLVAYIALMIKLISIKTLGNALYAKAYIIYAAVANVTIGTLLDTIPLSICAYLIYIDHLQYINSKNNE